MSDASIPNATTDRQWRLSNQGMVTGSHSEAYILIGLKAGIMSPDMLACPDGSDDWKAICEWPAFAPACTSPVPIIPVLNPSKWLATGRAVIVRVGKVTRYALLEARATIWATASLGGRAIKYGIALGYLRYLEQGFHRSQLDLGEQMCRGNVGDTAVRESIRVLDEQIEKERAARRSSARLLAERRELILRLAATSDAVALQGPEWQEVPSRQRELEEQHAAVKATRAGLLPSGPIEIRRVALGFGAIVLAIVAFGLSGQSGSPRAISEADHVPAGKQQQSPETPNKDADNAAQPSHAQDDEMTSKRLVAGQLIAAALKDAQLIVDSDDKDYAYCGIAEAQAAAENVAGAKVTAAKTSKYRAFVLCQIVKAQAAAGDVAGAKVTAADISDTLRQHSAYADIAAAQATAGDLTGAKATAAQIGDGYGKVSAYLSIAVAQAKAGDSAAARQSTKKALAVATNCNFGPAKAYGEIATIQPGEESISKELAYQNIAEVQVVVGDAAGARESLKTVANDTEETLAGLQVHAGDVAGAKVTADGMSKEKAKWLAYGYIAVAQAGAGDVAGAKATAAAIPDRDNERVKLVAHLNLAIAQARVKDMAGASQSMNAAKNIASQIEKADVKLVAHLNLAVAQARVKDMVGASQSMNAAKNIASQTEKADVKASAFAQVAAYQAKIGDIAGATATAAQVKDEMLGLAHENDKAMAYAFIAIAELKARDCAGALASTAKINKKGLKAFIYHMIVVTEAMAGDVTKAKMHAAMIDDGVPKVRAYAVVGAVQAKSRDVAGARETIEEAIKSVVGMTDDPRERCRWISKTLLTLFTPQSNPLSALLDVYPSEQQELDEELRSE